MLLSRSEHTVAVAAVLGALAILGGAFGGHGLRTILSPQDLQTYQTAVQYHMISTLALLGVGILQGQWRQSLWLARAATGLLLGCLLFSGSLYSLTLLEARFMGFVTPIGGIMLVGGWLCLAVAALTQDS